MDEIQVSLKANETDGILSIQGIDMFRLINVNWNWDNVPSIENPLLKTFFTQAKEELFIEDDEDQCLTGTDDFADWTHEDWKNELGHSGTWEKVPEGEDLSNNIEISYDEFYDFSNRTEICLETPYYKIIWDESVFLYIYNNLDLWLHRIEENIKIYKELGNIRNDIDRIISVIRTANGPTQAIQNLMQKFDISEMTAKAICEMKLTKLIHELSCDCTEEEVLYREEQKVIFNKLIDIKKEINKEYSKFQNYEK